MIEKFGIFLEPLTLKTAMLVRVWRNSPKVSHFMDYKDYISEEQQVKWYESTVESENYFFIVKDGTAPIGLIHLDRFAANKKSAYAGLFIGSEEFEGTGVAFKASLALLEFAFEELKLETVFAKVHGKNTVALDYNKNLGFEHDGKESVDFLRLKIDLPSFAAKRPYILKLLTL